MENSHFKRNNPLSWDAKTQNPNSFFAFFFNFEQDGINALVKARIESGTIWGRGYTVSRVPPLPYIPDYSDPKQTA